MSDIDVLERVLAKDGALLAAVRDDQLTGPTPCPDYDVQTLVDHMVGWVRVFAAAAKGGRFDGDPMDVHSTDPAADFRSSSAELISGWRTGGLDRTVNLVGPEVPAEMALSMTLMEYTTHGCDLALATGQPVPFDDEELERTLERARRTLPDQYRGEGRSFGPVIPVAEDAPALDRLLGFMGRRV